MTLRKIFDLGLINDDTGIWIRNPDMCVLEYGGWNAENILKYLDRELECFTWQDDDNFYVDLK